MEKQEFIKKLVELEKRIETLENILLNKENTAYSSNKDISIKEFILMKIPKNDVQKTLCIGYYLEVYKNYGVFNSKDIEEGYILAKERIPKNINDKINMNKNKGYIMEAKEKKDKRVAWVLTNSGEAVVKTDFKKDI